MFKPKTALGKRLLELREQAIAEGMQLMTEEEIALEVKSRRGELSENLVLLTEKIQDAVKARNPKGWTFPYAEVYKILEKGYPNAK